MPNYRRARVPGATYFFTVALAERGGQALVEGDSGFPTNRGKFAHKGVESGALPKHS